MKVKEKKIDDLNRELTIEVAAADYAEIEKKKLADRRKTAEFKGFRKGMVPASLIKRVYGEQALVESVNQVIGQALDKHINDKKLHILGEPLASANQPELTWESGNDFTFVFDLGLAPEVNVEVEKADTVLLVFGSSELKSVQSAGELGVIQSADESREPKSMSSTGRWEVVGSYGWYMHYFINDIKEKGAVAVIVNDESNAPEKVLGWNRQLAERFGVELRTYSATGISDVTAPADAKPAPSYNLSGQTVADGYKGIVIRNGRKYVVR